MPSRILGKIELDQILLADDLATLASFPRIEEAYDEFSSGYWKNCSLWNASGEASDTTYRDINSQARETDYGRKLPYLESVVRKHFDMSRVTMVRARNLVDAMVIPHRDFVELEKSKERYFRLFMVLEDNPAALHSDETGVFRMRPGEVWFLDAASVHAAVNFSTNSRQSICVDFVFDGPFEDWQVFANQKVYRPDITPEKPFRQPPQEEEFSERLRALAAVIDHDNFKDVLFLLSKVHFRTDVPITATYDWLVEVCKESGDATLTRKAEKLRRYMVEKRVMDERLSIASAA
ncbi:aspartyl/asparaginyl beta-hydroxylase domain-containing protein [Streptomyces sp. NPDC048420]|uniref:aspartyl/asparaginyl beta-hydroxylase domain-containing protein n=1 Tax=Streptomyces sp. NPDC048420 TaxID=3155755 RepID=UPI00343DB5AD